MPEWGEYKSVSLEVFVGASLTFSFRSVSLAVSLASLSTSDPFLRTSLFAPPNSLNMFSRLCIVHAVAAVLAAVLLVAPAACSTPKLQTYNVDASQVSVSGISAGGFFAVQFHVANSESVMGAGIVAGGPFYCANDNMATALSACMKTPSLISITELTTVTYTTYETTRTIDNPKYLKDDRVFVYSGTKDTVVHAGVVMKLNSYYANFVDSGNMKAMFNVSSGHAMITNDYGNECDTSVAPYINNCGIDLAYDILSHIYGPSTQPGLSSNTSNLQTFDQSEFTYGLGSLISMDSIGYLYVPTVCQSPSNPRCKLHIVFHGCLQGRHLIDETFVLHAGYNRHAEENGVIILYPQVTELDGLNPKGCWDWWGYTGTDYGCKLGPQMHAVRKMMDRILGTKEERDSFSMAAKHMKKQE